MARPIKTNADKFTHSADLYNAPKVKELRKAFGLVGYAVWCYLLEQLTKADGALLNIGGSYLIDMANELSLPAGELSKIISYCEKIDLLVRDGDVVYNADMKEQMEVIMERRRKKREQYAIKKGKQPSWIAQAVLSNEKPVQPARDTSSRERTVTEASIPPPVETALAVIYEEAPYEYTKADAQLICDYYNEKIDQSTDCAMQKVGSLGLWRTNNILPRLQEYGIEYVKTAIDKAFESDFLRKSHFSSFDWIIKEEHLPALTENKYANRPLQNQLGPVSQQALVLLQQKNELQGIHGQMFNLPHSTPQFLTPDQRREYDYQQRQLKVAESIEKFSPGLLTGDSPLPYV